jgi:hypothetical protein
LNEGIAPKSSKDKGIELIKTTAGVALNTGKYIATRSNKISARNNKEQSDNAESPHSQIYGCLNDGH